MVKFIANTGADLELYKVIIVKKKVALLSSIMMLFAGVAIGSSINGNYNGNPIVKVFVNGNEVKSEVPAMIYEGSTVLPLRAVSESLGLTAQWDPVSYSVYLTTKNTQSNSVITPPVLTQPNINSATTAQKIAACTLIENNYNDQKRREQEDLNDRGLSISSIYDQTIKSIEDNKQLALTAAGCK